MLLDQLVVELIQVLELKHFLKICKVNKELKKICKEKKNLLYFIVLKKDLHYNQEYNENNNYSVLYKKMYKFTEQYKRDQIKKLTKVYKKFSKNKLSEDTFSILTEKLLCKIQFIQNKQIVWVSDNY
jgi:uncharacterized protein with gpF-like domain